MSSEPHSRCYDPALPDLVFEEGEGGLKREWWAGSATRDFTFLRKPTSSMAGHSHSLCSLCRGLSCLCRLHVNEVLPVIGAVQGKALLLGSVTSPWLSDGPAVDCVCVSVCPTLP